MFSGGVEDCGSVADKGVPSGVEVEVVGVDGSGGTSWSASAVADDIGASRLRRTFPPRNYVRRACRTSFLLVRESRFARRASIVISLSCPTAAAAAAGRQQTFGAHKKDCLLRTKASVSMEDGNDD